ncbi:hypothetical protein DID76_03130 [Candidatus Marinamargulisbacteria bacterium SCGC AG-414-C22]|nr:hypothetical protein DID76_03130 [Candidatus Marinamargulisbacteria bacterium SCGC AG-414-C22]
MYNITDLVDSVDRNDPVAFLMVYLNLIAQKTSLQLPTRLIPEEVAQQWRDIIPPKCGHCSDIFIEKLSTIWVELVTSHGGRMSDFFVQELITLLVHHKKNKSLKSIVKGGPKIGMNPNLMRVTPSISTEYFNENEILAIRPIPKEELEELIPRCLDKQNVVFFLSYYLELALLDSTLTVPKMSVLKDITAEWKRLILFTYKVDVKKTFLESLASVWYRLVHMYGIPFKAPKLKKILIEFRKYNKDILDQDLNTVETPASAGLLGGLFGFLK